MFSKRITFPFHPCPIPGTKELKAKAMVKQMQNGEKLRRLDQVVSLSTSSETLPLFSKYLNQPGSKTERETQGRESNSHVWNIQGWFTFKIHNLKKHGVTIHEPFSFFFFDFIDSQVKWMPTKD